MKPLKEKCNMKTIDDFIIEESKRFTAVNSPEALQLLLYNVAKNSADYFVTEALKATHRNMQLSEEDIKFTLDAYPLKNIK